MSNAWDEIGQLCLRLVSLLGDDESGVPTMLAIRRDRVGTELRDALTAELEGRDTGREALRSESEARAGEWLEP